MKIGIQTNIWSQERHEKDLDGLLGEARAAGYAGIEIGAHRVDLTQPGALRALLAKHGLQVSALHIHGDLADAEQAIAIAERAQIVGTFARQVGAPYVALSGKARTHKSENDLAREAQLLNHVGYVCGTNGAHLIYHNHYWEIENDYRELRYLVAHTDAARVSLLLDVGWVNRVNGKPAQAVELFRARIACFHLKDTFGDWFTELGRGTLDFAALKPAILGKFDGWLVHERDEAVSHPLESARISREFLKTNLGL
jgi:sugar phosphate isomerase/epimerase